MSSASHRVFSPQFSSAPQRFGWILMLGCSVGVGLLLGITITGLRADRSPPAVGDPDLEKVPVIRVSKPAATILALTAGIMLGAVGAGLARSHPRLAALTAGALASITSVATIVLLQWQRGRWPIGVIDGHMLAVAPALLLLVCSAGLLTAMAASHRRRARRC